MNTTVLEVQELHGGGFGPVSFELAAGVCLGVSGVSGSGKSRMLRAIVDLDPHEGQVLLAAKPRGLRSGPQWRSMVGYVPADSRWWAETVREHFLRPDHLPLKSLGLDKALLASASGRLSSGERQRLALLRQWELQPQVLLLDEPTANLDEENREQFEDFVREYQRQQQAAVVWVSHDHGQLQRVSDRQMRMEQGRIREVAV